MRQYMWSSSALGPSSGRQTSLSDVTTGRCARSNPTGAPSRTSTPVPLSDAASESVSSSVTSSSSEFSRRYSYFTGFAKTLIAAIATSASRSLDALERDFSTPRSASASPSTGMFRWRLEGRGIEQRPAW
eukprot:4017111-Prymnesium_polylepis.2